VARFTVDRLPAFFFLRVRATDVRSLRRCRVASSAICSGDSFLARTLNRLRIKSAALTVRSAGSFGFEAARSFMRSDLLVELRAFRESFDSRFRFVAVIRSVLVPEPIATPHQRKAFFFRDLALLWRRPADRLLDVVQPCHNKRRVKVRFLFWRDLSSSHARILPISASKLMCL